MSRKENIRKGEYKNGNHNEKTGQDANKNAYQNDQKKASQVINLTLTLLQIQVNL